jgi:AraC-like DNA-binding protein
MRLGDSAMNPTGVTSVLALGGEAKFARHDVDPRLADKIDCYWTFTVERPSVELRIIPDGRIDLIFDLDTGEAFIAGPNQRPFDVRHERQTRLLGATMSPEIASAALETEIGAIGGEWRALDSVLGPFARQLAGRIVAGESDAARLAVLETFLLARIGAVDRRVSRAVAGIARSNGRIGVAALSRDSGASPRNLTRLFDRWVGLPPKTFARIARAQEALRRLQETPAPNFKTLAAELGFADQAHMSRELKKITGVQPSQMSETFKRASEIFKP